MCKKLIEWYNKRIKRLTIWEIKSLKLSMLFFGFFLATLIPAITNVSWIVWLALWILFSILPAYKVLKK